MRSDPTAIPVLSRLRAALDAMYGDRLDRAILYGSRARGDARDESDYDVAVFIKDLADRFTELYRLADMGTAILGETGAFVHAVPFRADGYDDRTPLMREIRREGVPL